MHLSATEYGPYLQNGAFLFFSDHWSQFLIQIVVYCWLINCLID
jgi:hypothetical protein